MSNRSPNKHGVNNNGPQSTTHKSTDWATMNPNKHGVNNNGPQNTTHKSTDWATGTPINTGWTTMIHKTLHTNLQIEQQEPQ